jgi:hypothetical protein
VRAKDIAGFFYRKYIVAFIADDQAVQAVS